MCEIYNIRPSEALKVKAEEEYTAYCIDQAIGEFMIRLQKGEKPKFKNKDKSYNPGLKFLMK